MQKSDNSYNEISQEMENLIIHDIVNQFIPFSNGVEEKKVKILVKFLIMITI